MDRRTKIVVTLGPASDDEQTIEQMLHAGVDVVRLNFSHGTHASHAIQIARLRRVFEKLNHPVTLMQDLQGPKIRTGELEKGSVTLNQGQRFILTTEPVPGDEHKVSVDYAELPHSVSPGGRILLDDGNLELAVISTGETEIEPQVLWGGELKPHKGINLPRAQLNLRALTEKDEADLAFGLSQEVDAVALSFVRSRADVARLRQAISRLLPGRKDTTVIAKLERPEALDNLNDIVESADGVMVARGDLGVEMSPEEVPIAQKRIIAAANRHGKVVITATQMLESMISKPRPTRAEASDVANAIFDGTAAGMLSARRRLGSTRSSRWR